MSADTLAPRTSTGAPARRTSTGAAGARRVWAATWPKVIALGLTFAVWEATVLSGWRPTFVLPSPVTVLQRLWALATTDERFWPAVGTTLSRAGFGFALAVAIGTVVGLAVSRSTVLRAGLGALITGLQTMPSITWFPLAILLFGAGEEAISFVVVLGAAPSIANGVISGIDQVPPAFRKLGTVLGARGWDLYRFVVVPASLPAYVGGLSQGWAFAWRSLMAGELLVIVQNRPSLGARLGFAQDVADAPSLMAYMLVVLVLGMLADTVFSSASRRLRARRGLSTD